jgi:hypothetical protein
MAQIQEIIAQAGPLPINATATISTDGPTMVTVAGSVWTTQANAMIGVQLAIDGQVVAKAQIYSNGPDTHRAVVPVTISYTFPMGSQGPEPHEFALTPLTSQTTSDFNDFFTVSVLY